MLREAALAGALVSSCVICLSEARAQVPSQRTAISCLGRDGGRAIYVIDDRRKMFLGYNATTKKLEPVCGGGSKCKWTYTDSSISFDNSGVGFLVHGELDRTAGTMRLRSAFDQVIIQACKKTRMPVVTANKF